MKLVLLVMFIFSSISSFGEVEVLDFSDLEIDEQVDLNDMESRSKTTEVQSLNVDEILEPNGNYQYSSASKVDPFEPANLTEMREKLRSSTGEYIEIQSPLQSYPVDQLKVKGMWILPDGQARAMIMTPKKEGFIIKEGDLVSAGKVMSITKEKVVVRQYKLSVAGTREYEDNTLTIGRRKNKQRKLIYLRPGGTRLFQGEKMVPADRIISASKVPNKAETQHDVDPSLDKKRSADKVSAEGAATKTGDK